MKYTDKNNRPKPIDFDHSVVPQPLRECKNWVMWRYEWKPDKTNGSWAKIPMQPNGEWASTTNPETWSAFETVVSKFHQAVGRFDGIGFVFSKDQPFVGIDLDNCVSVGEDNFELTPFAARVVDRLSTYSELSPSKTGIHCIGIAGDMPATKTAWNGNEIEVYRDGRYFTFTGVSWHEKVLEIVDISDDLDVILSVVKNPEAKNPKLTIDVEKRIEMALRNPKVDALFYGNTLDYGGDDSRADLALCSLLAYYSEGSEDILDAMFRRSKLMRTKWDERRGAETYGQRTCRKALANHSSFVSVKQTKLDRIPQTHETRKVRRFGINDLWDAAMEYRKSPASQGVTTGWPSLDQFYRPAKGMLSVVTGTPGSGKSTWVDVLSYNIALRHGWTIAYASFETLPLERHVLNLCQIHLGKPTYAFMSGSATDAEMEQAREDLHKYFRFFMPQENEMDIVSILSYVDDEIRENGLDGFVLDPYTELSHVRPAGMTQTEHIEVVLRQLQHFTRFRDIHTWLIAHPTKSGDTYTNGRPSLYSINGSAHFYNKADYGIIVDRTTNDETKIFVDKVRNDVNGTRGEVGFRFDRVAKQYMELDPIGEVIEF